MELLRGETLASRIRLGGCLTAAEALPLIKQIAEGLVAAHSAGVIHRDFKCANVILASSSKTGETRAVITDFGLARNAPGVRDGEERTASIQSGTMAGTPEYMAPEQLTRGEATTASDIYSFGLVMYEMITGTRPFAGETPFAAAIQRLQVQPPSPRKYIPDLSPQWEAAIMRCLERNPADRFSSAADVERTIEGEAVSRPPRLVMRRRLALAIAAVLLVLAPILYFAIRTQHQGVSETAVTASNSRRRSVAVLGFLNAAKRPDAGWLSTALSEMLTTELAMGGKLRSIPGESVARAMMELSLGSADSFGKETLAKIRKNLGADLIVTGSYIVLVDATGQFRFDLRLQDAEAGDTLASVAETGTQSNLFALVSSAGARLRAILGEQGLSTTESAAVRAVLPQNPEAQRFYAEGLQMLRRFDALGARERLQKAIAIDFSHPMIHSAMSAVWSALGYDSSAMEEAKIAFDLSGRLTREEKYWIEGQLRETAREWDKAIEVYRALWGFFPDNLDYGLRLAAAQTSGGRPKEALATVEALRRQPGADDPRIDLAESRAAGALSEFRRQEAAGVRAAEKGSAQGAQLLVAEAKLAQSSAQQLVGKPSEARSSAEESRRIFELAGDRAGAARALSALAGILQEQSMWPEATAILNKTLATQRAIGDKSGEARSLFNLALVVRNQGDLLGARKLQEESLDIRRAIADRRGAAACLNGLGNILRQMGDLEAAKVRYKESLAVSRQIGEKHGVSVALGNLAIVLRVQGDRAGAMAANNEVLRMEREIGEKRGIAMTLTNIANLYFDQGDLGRSVKGYEESLAVSRELNDRRGVAQVLNNMAGVLLLRGDYAAAKKYCEESLAICRETGEKRGIARTLDTLAGLTLLLGDLAKAKKLYEESIAISRAGPYAIQLGFALSGMGELSLTAGDLTGAQKLQQEALEVRKKLGGKDAVASSRVSIAELALEEGRPQEAEKSARATIKEFLAAKDFEQEMRTRIVLARSLLAQGRFRNAEIEIEEANNRVAASEYKLMGLWVSIPRARIMAALGNPAEALKNLLAIQNAARKSGLTGLQFEAGLAIAEIEMNSGNPAGRSHLQSLAEEARNKGYHLIAQKASRASGK
jgi:eukaryotic-like serine/threonine-protein kinase